MTNEGRKIWTISEFVRLFKAGNIVLEPEFQRSHAWTNDTRASLIESLLSGQPVPEIVVFRAEGADKFIVIDGKQRLETILHFLGVAPISGLADLEVCWQGKTGTYRDLLKASEGVRVCMADYRLGVVLQSGSLDEAGQLFLSWNTCSGLKPAEVRNARQYSNPLFQEVKRLSKVLDQDLKALKVVSSNPADRMDKEEILAELLCTCYGAQRKADLESIILNGKDGLDAVLDRVRKEHADAATQQEVGESVAAAASDVQAAIQTMRKAFPAIPTGRFRYRGMFYALFVWVWLAIRAGYQADLAGGLAQRMNETLSQLSEDLRNASKARPDQPLRFQEEVARIVATLGYATDGRIKRTRRMTALANVFSRELGPALNMEAFPSLEELLSDAQVKAEAA